MVVPESDEPHVRYEKTGGLAVLTMNRSQDAIEGPRAFMARRPGVFEGR